MNPFNTQYNSNIGNIQQAYQMLMNSKNPTQLFMNMARQNPRLQPIANMLNNGVNPEQIFNQMCAERGINPQEFINTITNNSKR